MKTKLGIVIIVLGVLLLAVAAVLLVGNQQEQQRAEESVEQVMPQMVEVIQQRQETAPEELTEPEGDPLRQPLSVVEIDGDGYIGFVGIPALGLELPVMSDWSYPQLKRSPCRFTGDIHTEDLVIMAHNYARHFGPLKDLKSGDTVTFTDMDGQTTYYQVVAKDVLEPTDVENMTAGEFDLTLFTCTYGGKSRVTVRCDEVASPAG